MLAEFRAVMPNCSKVAGLYVFSDILKTDMRFGAARPFSSGAHRGAVSIATYGGRER